MPWCGTFLRSPGVLCRVALLLALLVSAFTDAGANGDYQMKVALPGYGQPETLSNFPALVIFNTNLPGFAYSQFAAPANGGDLRFTDSGGAALNFEIERWDTNTQAGFSVTNISGCDLWLKADDGVQTSGSSVTGWLDRSGSNNNASQATASYQPTLVNGVLNGLPIVRFDGVDDCMDTPALTGRTVFAVFNYTDAVFPANWPTALGEYDGGNFSYIIQGRANSGTLLDQQFAIGGTRYINGVMTPVANSGYEFGPITAHKIVCVALDADKSLTLRIGQDRNVGGRCWKGDFAEIIIYNRALKAAEQSQVTMYLAKKYALAAAYVPPGHSYVWVQVPTLSGTNTTIWARWGDRNNTNLPTTATNGSVWTASGCSSVWHLPEDGANNRYDSAAGVAGTPTAALSVPGVIGWGNSFNGSSSKISTAYGQPAVTSYTVSAWIRTRDAGGNRAIIQDRGSDTGVSLTLGIGKDAGGQAFFGPDANGILVAQKNSPTVNDNSWHHLAGVWSTPAGGSANSGQVVLYIDGVKAATAANDLGSAVSPLTGAGAMQIAYHQMWGTYFAGSLDEIRTAPVVCSSNWIWASWLNQASNGIFCAYGNVDKIPRGTVILLR